MVNFNEKEFDNFNEASEFVASLNVSNPTCQITMFQNGVNWQVTWLPDENIDQMMLEIDHTENSENDN